MSPQLSATPLVQRPIKRKRAYEGLSLRNADAHLDKVPNEKPVPVTVRKSKQDIVLSTADRDKAFRQTPIGWLTEHRSDPTTPGFQSHSFDSELDKPSIVKAKNAFGTQGFDIADLKGGNERIGWRLKTPWWLKDQKRVADFFRHEYGIDKDGSVLTNKELAEVAGIDLEILKKFYQFRMSDEDIWDEMELDFTVEINSEAAGRIRGHKRWDTTSKTAVKQRRLALVKRGDELHGSVDPNQDARRPDIWKEIRDRKMPTQPPGWIQMKVVPQGQYGVPCSVADCPEIAVTSTGTTAASRYLCRNHSVWSKYKKTHDLNCGKAEFVPGVTLYEGREANPSDISNSGGEEPL
jgi:hypothetical protein